MKKKASQTTYPKGSLHFTALDRDSNIQANHYEQRVCLRRMDIFQLVPERMHYWTSLEKHLLDYVSFIDEIWVEMDEGN